MLIELLLGAMMTSSGFVMEAYLMLDMSRHLISYDKWLQKGHLSCLALALQFARLMIPVVQEDTIQLAIDDTLTLQA